MRITILPLLTVLSLAALPAAAQVSQLGGLNGQNGASGGAPAVKPPNPDKKAVVPPPDAVPGAKPRADSVTPLKGGTNDLPPTESLFDAINRGDITTARDAINRGADLDSTNMLGLTPIELSVDLGRNDISFLLLSLRGASGSSQAGVHAASAAPAPAPDRRPRRVAAPPTVTANVREAAPETLHAPALFAGNGGAPVPAAGFLGFDPHR